MRRLAVALLLFVTPIFLVGCSSVSNTSADQGGGGSLQPISVSLAGTASTVNAGGAAFQITATVSNDPSNRGVQWFLQVPIPSGSQFNCAPTCGTLTNVTPFSVTYTPPPTVPGSLTLPGQKSATDFSSPTLVAIATADNTKNASNAFKIQGTPDQVLGVQIQNPITTTTTGGNAVVFQVSLTNDVNNLGVSWTLTQFGSVLCSGSLSNPNVLCGEMVNVTPFSAVFVPPLFPALGGGALTVTVSANSDITKTASDTFQVQQAAAANNLHGQYAFQLRGFDSSGAPVAMAGSFTADGFGNITAGEIDINDNQAIGGNNGISGNYYIDPSLRGNFTIVSSLGGVSLNFPNFAFSLSADGSHGTIIGFDKTNGLTSGTIEKQDPTSFSLGGPPSGGINNDYIFKMESNLPERYSAVGHMSIDLDSTINVFIDTSRANLQLGLVDAEFLGHLLQTPDSNGRGMMTFGGWTFVYYTVSSQTLYLVQVDTPDISNALFSGVIKFQPIQGFTADTVNGTGVFRLTGLDLDGQTPAPIVSIGTLAVTNQNSAALLWDTNIGGTLLSQMQISGQPVTFDPPSARTGRGTVTIANGRLNGLADSFVFYLAGPGEGFVLDTSPGSTNRAMVGDLLPQTGSGSFDNSSLNGNLLLSAGGSSRISIPNADGLLSASSGNFGGIADFTAPSGKKIPINAVTQPYQQFMGTYTGIDPVSGRGTALFPGALFGQVDPVAAVFYLAGPNRLVAISSQAGVSSGVSSFDPQ